MAFDILFLLGRIIVGGYYLINAMNHFTKTKMLTEYAKSKNVPMPTAAVLLSGIVLLIGGASILLGVYPELGVLALGVFLVTVSFSMHNFWAVPEDQKMQEMVNFMKNMALLGSALMYLAIAAPWAWSV